jgi:hypothetical protein
MKYTEFVKQHMQDPKVKALPPKDRMKAIAAMWKASGHSKKTGKGKYGDMIANYGGPVGMALGQPELAALSQLGRLLPF